MRYQILSVGLFFIIFVPYQSEAKNKCFNAKICLHDAKEICGEDHDKNARRFFDTCDMKEYNCLKDTNYVKVSFEHCQNLPPIEDKLAEKTLNDIEEKEQEQEADKSLENNAETSKEEPVEEPVLDEAKDATEVEEDEDTKKDE